ncbi:MAG: RNA polymerase sigma factor [Bacteroidia bacterium]|nr:RNA polymerase sigma factor [Bacteroidia bacterium]
MLSEHTYRMFVREHSDSLFRYAYFFLKNQMDAEDVLQECLLKLWDIRKTTTLRGNPRAFVFRMIKNKCIDRLRKEKRNPIGTAEELPETASAAQALSTLEVKESKGQLMHIIQQLPELQREILILRNMEGCSIEEIAESLDMKINTVEVYLSRARKKVRAAYTKIEKS